MAQVKIYGLASHLATYREPLSSAIHASLMSVLKLPAEKKFQRFIALDPQDFIYPADRSDRYVIIEIHLLSGRSSATRRALIAHLMDSIQQYCGIRTQDIEITLFESPPENWGIRGQNGADLQLDYRIDI